MAQHALHVLGKQGCAGKHVSGRLPKTKQVLFARSLLHPQTELLTQLNIVAKLRMGIQGKVVRVHIEVMLQEQPESLLHPASDATILSTPEQAMVHQQGIGSCRDGRLDECTACRDSRHQPTNLRPALDLQSIGAIIAEAAWLQYLVQRLQQFIAVHEFSFLKEGRL